MTGDDYSVNVVQWFSFIGSIIVISHISKQLGLSQKQQIWGSLFFATLPIAILEASSTQNDFVVTYWILCAVDRFLVLKSNRCTRHFVEFGLAVGLAVLTKGTAYVILAPVIISFAFFSLKNSREYLLKSFLTALICLGINFGHYYRSYQHYGTPVYANQTTKSNFTLKSFLLSGFGNLYTNVPIPIPNPEQINERLSNMDSRIFPYWAIYIYSTNGLLHYAHDLFLSKEDVVKNMFHTILLFITMIILAINRKKSIGHILYWFSSMPYLFLIVSRGNHGLQGFKHLCLL